MQPLIPILILGGALFAISRKPKKTGQKALPAPETTGRIYYPGDVDVIVAKKGEEFTVALESLPGSGYQWELSASPADDSIKFVDKEVLSAGAEEPAAIEYFNFKAAKQGTGSLVFHYLRPWMKDEQPPDEIFEVQVRIK